MYPSYATIREPVRRAIKAKKGDHMKVRFTNRNGKLYCTVVDNQSGQYDNTLMIYVRDVLLNNGSCSASLTSAGGGHYTYRFEMEDSNQ